MRYALGRRHAPDARDLNYPLRALLPPAPSTRTYRYWGAQGWWGDQGPTPRCVGYSWVHWLEDGPTVQRSTPPPIVNPDVLYHEAQKVDEWEGEAYDGISVRAGAKVLQAMGFISAYHWAASVEEIVQAILEKGPVVVGSNWYTSMFDPDPEGFLHVSGGVAGGHAYVLNGVNTTTKLFRLKNSWGRSWARNGHAYISISDLAGLFADDGEACLAVEISK